MLHKLLNKHATPILSLHVIDSSIYHLRYPDKQAWCDNFFQSPFAIYYV